MGLLDGNACNDKLYGIVLNIRENKQEGTANAVRINMDKELKVEARKQYLHYFRFWFMAVAVVLVAFLVAVVGKIISSNSSLVINRNNTVAPTERVYDYADVLTNEEEIELRSYIAKCEEIVKCDIVLVTTNIDMEAIGVSANTTESGLQVTGGDPWETAMMDTADKFYDDNHFGYNEPNGDGVLLLDNWYEDQEGSWLCTTGKVLDRFSTYDIDEVLDAVYYKVEDSPYKAYRAYVDTFCEIMTEPTYEQETAVGTIFSGFVVITIACLIYVAVNANQAAAKDTTTATEYVKGGRPVLNVSEDRLTDKRVTSRVIQTSSSGGGGSHRSGGGGSHRSSSGRSHGGGGRRR